MESTWLHPSLWRVTIFTLVLGLFANVFLWSIVADDDWFAKMIAVASGIAGLGILAGWFRFHRCLDDFLLATFAIWIANALEFALQDGPRWENQVRQCCLYLSEGLLALGAYVAAREARANG